MYRGIGKIFIAGAVIAMVQPAFSMEIYTVKSNDYLYKIAKNHSISGISTSEMTDAIRGINKSEIPGIIDNRIKIGDKLAIPTTKGEVEDGLTLTRNQMIHGSYDQTTNDSSDTSPSTTVERPSLSNSSASSDLDNSSLNQPSVISQDKVPSLIPGEDNAPQTYQSDLNSQISSDNIQETESSDAQSSGSFFGSLFKLVFYILILAVIFFFAKRFWDSRNSKKELKLEIISKKKRDHLMSRISPVVSDNDFYRPDRANNGPQEEFDFFDNAGGFGASESQKNIIKEQDDYDDIANGRLNDPLDNDFEHNLYKEQDKSVAVKTEKGVVFETNTDETLVSSSDEQELVQEIDSQQQIEQELQYINELVEQFMESEKYVEASITIQDSLEKNPNNIDLRYKLLEVYAKAGDEIAFEGEVHFIKSKNIVSMFDPLHQKIAKLRDKYFE
jgi:Tfp pilus assembly protein FimV